VIEVFMLNLMQLGFGRLIPDLNPIVAVKRS